MYLNWNENTVILTKISSKWQCSRLRYTLNTLKTRRNKVVITSTHNNYVSVQSLFAQISRLLVSLTRSHIRFPWQSPPRRRSPRYLQCWQLALPVTCLPPHPSRPIQQGHLWALRCRTRPRTSPWWRHRHRPVCYSPGCLSPSPCRHTSHCCSTCEENNRAPIQYKYV